MEIDDFEDYLELQDQEVQRHVEMSGDELRGGQGRPASIFLAELKAMTQRNATQLPKVIDG